MLIAQLNAGLIMVFHTSNPFPSIRYYIISLYDFQQFTYPLVWGPRQLIWKAFLAFHLLSYISKGLLVQTM